MKPAGFIAVRRDISGSSLSTMWTLLPHSPEALEDAHHVESMLLLREVTQRLDGDDLRLFLLWLNEYSYRDIAIKMNSKGIKMSHVTVALRLKLILGRLRDSILG